ncbi:MAG: DNA/RNA non-specific endonuclease, partial [Alistipes sp.]|nr:DNA/RNA non-specific endonuclease [Alistipes sp.]
SSTSGKASSSSSLPKISSTLGMDSASLQLGWGSTGSSGSSGSISVPRYFYKVILKVNSAENPTSASAIGFWFCNKSYSGSYESFAVSVDEIESKLGMDFFPNLTNSLENAAEKNSSWNTFKSF